MIDLISRRFITMFTCLAAFALAAPAVWADVYFPQIAAGGGYITVVTLMHVDMRSPAPAIGRLKFYNPDGSARSVTTAEFGQGGDFSITVPSQGTRVVTITAPGDVAVGTAVFEIAGVSVGGVARYTFAGASVGVINAKATQIGYVPLTTRAGFSNGIAVQNPLATPVNVRLRLLNPNGTVDQTSSPSGLNPLPPFGQFAKFVGAEMGFNNPVQANSTLEIAVQGAGSVTVLPLVLGNNYYSTASVITNDTDAPLFFAQVVDGGGYSTTFRLFNPTPYNVTGLLKFYTQSGTARTLPIAGLGNVAFITVSLQAGRTVSYETTGTSLAISGGMARLDTSVPIGGLATIFFGQTHVGVPSTSVMRSGRIAVDTTNNLNTGVALGTAGPNNVNIRLTLQDRDGVNAQISTPPELTPLRVNQQFAKYVTEMGFANTSNLKESSLLVEPIGAGTYVPLALLDNRGAFSSTATSRQRLFNPQANAGTYTGPLSLPALGTTTQATIVLTVDANNKATIKLTIAGTEYPPVSATYNEDGELNTSTQSLGNLVNIRGRADGSFMLSLVNLGTGLSSPVYSTDSGGSSSLSLLWALLNGAMSGPTVAGFISYGLSDGTTGEGSFNLAK